MSILPTEKINKPVFPMTGKVGMLLVAVLIVLVSCHSKERRPTGILSKKEMALALGNIYLLENKASKLALRADSGKLVFKKLMVKLLDSLNIQDSVLEKSFDYYAGKPHEFQEIYAEMVDSLNLKEQQANRNPMVK